MKFLKLFSVIAMSIVTINLSAALSASAVLTISTLDGQNEAEIQLYENAAVADDFSSPICAIYNESNFNNYAINAWVVGGTKNYSVVELPSLDNLALKFKANQYDSLYVMSFSTVSGSITLASADTSFIIDATKPFNFTCAKSATIEFTINPQANVYERDVTSGDFGTICLPWASTSLTGATFYKVLGNHATKGVALEAVDSLEAGEPYVFQASAAKIAVAYDEATEVNDPINTIDGIIGSFTQQTIAAGMYIIVNNVLRKTADATCYVRENGAYFDLSEMDPYVEPAPGAPVRFMPIQKGQATELEAIEAAKADGKMLINGQLIIVKDGVRYNAMGAKL